MAANILLAEDDRALSALILDFFHAAGLEVLPVFDGEQALAAAAEQSFDLLILDVMMPHFSGLEVCRRVREDSSVPILFITALSQEENALAGFRAGADDYITKPFSLAVLRARVDAALRRSKPAPASAVFEQDGFRFDFTRLDFTVDGKPLQLSQTEQRLLRLLVENRGHTLPRDTLLDRIWTDGAEYVDENALSVTVGRLRRKLGKSAPIKTVYGVGYTWAVEA